MANENDIVENVPTSKGEKFGKYDSYTGLDPDGHIAIERVYRPENDVELKERTVIENDTYFPKSEAYLIIDGMKALEPAMEHDKNEIDNYNDSLLEDNVVFQIRYNHQMKIRGVVYHYFGAYIYKRDVQITQIDAGFLPPKLQEVDGKFPCQPCNRYLDLKHKDIHIKSKGHKEREKLYENLSKPPKSETKMIYLQKYDPYVWRELLGETQFRQFGQPPKLKLPTNIRYMHVETDGEKTSHLIVPSQVWIMAEIQTLFKGKSIFRLA